MSSSLSVRLNTAGLFGVSAVLLYAFVHQIVLHDLPCPLCLLQRGCFIAAAWAWRSISASVRGRRITR